MVLKSPLSFIVVLKCLTLHPNGSKDALGSHHSHWEVWAWKRNLLEDGLGRADLEFHLLVPTSSTQKICSMVSVESIDTSTNDELFFVGLLNKTSSIYYQV